MMNNYYSANSSFCFTWLDPTVCVDLGNRFRTTQCIYCRRAKKKIDLSFKTESCFNSHRSDTLVMEVLASRYTP